MRKLFLSLLVVAGLTVACEQEQISDLHFDLSNTNIKVANLEREVEELKGLVSSEIAGVLRLVSELDFSTQEQFAQITADLSSSVDALADADAANLALLLQEVANTEQRLLDLIVDNAEAIQAQIVAQTGVNANLEAAIADAYASLDVAILNLKNTADGNLQTEVEQIEAAIASANTAIAANEMAIDELESTLGDRIGAIDFIDADELEARLVSVLEAIENGDSAAAAELRTLAERVTAVERLEARLEAFRDRTETQFRNQWANNRAQEDYINRVLAAAQRFADEAQADAQAYADNNDADTVFNPDDIIARLDAFDTDISNINTTLNSLQTQITAIDFVDADELRTAVDNVLADALAADETFDPSGLQTQLNALSTVVADIDDLQTQINNLGNTYTLNSDLIGIIDGLQNQINTVADSVPSEFDSSALDDAIAALQAELANIINTNELDVDLGNGWLQSEVDVLGNAWTINDDGVAVNGDWTLTKNGENYILDHNVWDMFNNGGGNVEFDAFTATELDLVNGVVEIATEALPPLAFATGDAEITTTRGTGYSVQLVNFDGTYTVRVIRTDNGSTREHNLDVAGNGVYTYDGHGQLSTHEIRVYDPDGGALLLTKTVRVVQGTPSFDTLSFNSGTVTIGVSEFLPGGIDIEYVTNGASFSYGAGSWNVANNGTFYELIVPTITFGPELTVTVTSHNGDEVTRTIDTGIEPAPTTVTYSNINTFWNEGAGFANETLELTVGADWNVTIINGGSANDRNADVAATDGSGTFLFSIRLNRNHNVVTGETTFTFANGSGTTSSHDTFAGAQAALQDFINDLL